MKKLLVYLLILLLFCGCAKGVESCPREETEPVEEGAPRMPNSTDDDVILESHYEEPEEPLIEEISASILARWSGVKVKGASKS